MQGSRAFLERVSCLMPNRYALIIGNSEYADSKLATLRTPDSDVNTLADVLRSPAMGNFDDVEVLLNRDSAIVRKTITRFFSNKKRDDLLLLYFSGHGVLDDRGRLFLAVKDTEHHLLRGTSLPASFITDEMDNCNSRRQILILDCCHSGAFARGTKSALGKSVGTSSAFMGNGSGRIVLTASDSTEYAWEGDRLLGSRQNSVFTHYLIKGIETGEADLNRDGVITVDELYDFAHENVSDSASKQTPGKWSYKQQGEIIIAKNPCVDLPASQTPAMLPFEEIKHAELSGPALFTPILKAGLAGGLAAVLLLIYPLYGYLPSLSVSDWHKGSAILAYLLMFVSLGGPAWSGWQIARTAKSGLEAIFLGGQAGSLAASIAYACILATAAGVYAFKPVLQILPATITDSNQLGVVLAAPAITSITYPFYTWLAAGLAGFVLGALGCLLKLRRSAETRSFFSFNLTFDIHWWKMIVGGVVSAVLILTLSTAVYRLLDEKVVKTAELAHYQIPALDKTFLDWFPTLPPLIGLLCIMVLGAISTLGSVPGTPSQQRLIAFYTIIASLLPWFNPLMGLSQWWRYAIYSTVYTLVVLLCAVSSMVLIVFSAKLIKKAGWGKLEPSGVRSFLGAQLTNAFLFVMLAAPALAVGSFYVFVFIQAISMFNGNSEMTVHDLVNSAFATQIRFNVIAILSIWILYTFSSLFLKPLLWVSNGITSLFFPQISKGKLEMQPSPAGGSPAEEASVLPGAAGDQEAHLPSKERSRLFKAAGIILGIPLLLVIGIKLFSKPVPPPVTPLRTPGFVWTLQAYTKAVYPTTTGFKNPATLTVAAAFTQLADSTKNPPGTSTALPSASPSATVTPITTLTPTGAMLHLEKNSACRAGPGEEYPQIIALAPGVKVPLLASSAEQEGWRLVLIRLSVSTNAVCWIENGIVEGDAGDIPAINYTPAPTSACAEC